MLQGIADGYAGIDAEKAVEVGLFAAGGKGDDAEGFVEGWVDHWAPPKCAEVLRTVLRGYVLSEMLIGLAPTVEKGRHVRSQANGWQLCAGWKTGTIGTRQTRGPPAHSRHNTDMLAQQYQQS